MSACGLLVEHQATDATLAAKLNKLLSQRCGGMC
jgi:hypothetical protein